VIGKMENFMVRFFVFTLMAGLFWTVKDGKGNGGGVGMLNENADRSRHVGAWEDDEFINYYPG
jgi:hypothetical protein